MRRASLYNTFSASLLLVCNACLSSCVSQIPLTKEKPVNNSTYQVEYLFEHEGLSFHGYGTLHLFHQLRGRCYQY